MRSILRFEMGPSWHIHIRRAVSVVAVRLLVAEYFDSIIPIDFYFDLCAMISFVRLSFLLSLPHYPRLRSRSRPPAFIRIVLLTDSQKAKVVYYRRSLQFLQGVL